ncbi:MAG: hypothetical protein AB7S38_17050 [Vulcanimicrobiota bacterium]
MKRLLLVLLLWAPALADPSYLEQAQAVLRQAQEVSRQLAADNPADIRAAHARLAHHYERFYETCQGLPRQASRARVEDVYSRTRSAAANYLKCRGLAGEEGRRWRADFRQDLLELDRRITRARQALEPQKFSQQE